MIIILHQPIKAGVYFECIFWMKKQPLTEPRFGTNLVPSHAVAPPFLKTQEVARWRRKWPYVLSVFPGTLISSYRVPRLEIACFESHSNSITVDIIRKRCQISDMTPGYRNDSEWKLSTAPGLWVARRHAHLIGSRDRLLCVNNMSGKRLLVSMYCLFSKIIGYVEASHQSPFEESERWENMNVLVENRKVVVGCT